VQRRAGARVVLNPKFRELSPPATDVMLCHLDAPGWAIVALELRGPEIALAIGSGGGSVIQPAPELEVDAELALSVMAHPSALFWQWAPAPRCTVYGRLPRDTPIAELRTRIQRIAPPMKALLTYTPPHVI
jgi:hypothetical protein